MKIIFRISIWMIMLLIAFIVFTNFWVIYTTRNQVYESLEALPATDVALVLGTSKRLSNGEANPYFYYRIEAAEQLYKSGKVKHLILSGDNETRYYNEPQYMKDALLKRDIPDSVITLDYAGFRTLDSVVRCKMIFGQNEFIVVTQRFHTYRAVFIADNFDIEAVAYAAENISLSKSINVIIREFLARPKAVLDVFIFNVKPRIMGEKEAVDVI